MKKVWIENRNDELSIKSRVKELEDVEYPDIDMDGLSFHPELSWEDELKYMDFAASQSKRLAYLTDRLHWDHQFELEASK